MFTWNTPQPLPWRLRELLDRAGASEPSGKGGGKADVLIFLPPDQILSCRQLSLEGIKRSYQSLLDIAMEAEKTGRHLTLMNGARLLALKAADLQGWRPGQALPKIMQLAEPEPVNALLTHSILEREPALLNLYLELDERSERGNNNVDQEYQSRIKPKNPADLIESLNKLYPISKHETAAEDISRQIVEIENECEKQLLLTRQLDIKLKFYRQAIAKYQQLLSRCLHQNARHM